ncbi:MAG: 3-methyl-2-oxobutanoate hydroxymethyltransferase [Synechococcus sp. TMED19]|nr:MAG: 3-methyl-2-oxobutanoate hydroxymethyltransferase [Synechococcus sp. TMED19]
MSLTPRQLSQLLQRRKQERQPITVLTAWDALSAHWAEAAGVDLVLVGDSLAMVALGHATTLPVTLEGMLHHAAAVERGLQHTPMVCDLPFLSYQCGSDRAVAAAGRFLKETGCEGVKLEGAEPETLEVIDRLVRTGIPVMGHLGLTPQSVRQLGYRRQATDPVAQEQLLRQARELQQVGCFALVLEHVPGELATRMSSELSLPVIGIGAGAGCDGQVRVSADLLGLTEQQPPFSKALIDGNTLIQQALSQWVRSVQHAPTPAADRPAPHCSGRIPPEPAAADAPS